MSDPSTNGDAGFVHADEATYTFLPEIKVEQMGGDLSISLDSPNDAAVSAFLDLFERLLRKPWPTVPRQ